MAIIVPMTAASLIAWRQRLGLRPGEVAKMLGVHRITYRRMEDPKRKKPLPYWLGYACAAVSYGLPPM